MFESGFEFKSIIIFNLIMTLTIWIRSFFLMPLTWMQSEIPPFYISPFFRQTLNSMPDAKSKEVKRKESMTAGKGVVRTNYQLRKSRTQSRTRGPTDRTCPCHPRTMFCFLATPEQEPVHRQHTMYVLLNL